VKLEAEAHAVSLESGLPKAFDGKDGIVRFVGRIFPTESDGEGGVALGPLAIDCLAIRRNGAFKMGADGSNVEFESGTAERRGAGFDGVDGLVEAVECRVQFALGILGEMENEVELSFAGLESARVDAFEGGQGGVRGLRPGEECSDKEKKRESGVTVDVAKHMGSWVA